MKISNETKIGALTAVAITILILGYSFLRGDEIFGGANRFYAVYGHVDGLTLSKPILVNGFQIGRVSKMKLQKNGSTLVEFNIDRQYEVPKNTIAKLGSAGLLAGKAIIFEYGNSNISAEDKDTLKAVTEGSLVDNLQPIQAKAEGLVNKLDSSLAAVNRILNPNFQKNVDRSFLSIANSLQTLEGTTKKIDDLVSTQTTHINAILANTETVTSNLKTSSAHLTAITNNFDKVSNDIAAANLKQTLDNAGKAVADLQATIAKMNSANGTLGELLNDKQVYDNLKDVTSNLNALFIDLKAHPKRYVSFSVFGGKKNQ
ncbi:MAG TPA: MlaD family protein [Mucilaginibacter sp.]|jgi:phospholipid/cholesterol/gamma-HCH transport system substrate-binding protein|nr:MlaD family protein [Mucilaginibacter sp.]